MKELELQIESYIVDDIQDLKSGDSIKIVLSEKSPWDNEPIEI
ncbi:MAG: hypothetical protein RSE41_00140 [Clostridia bacterium]